MQLSEMNGSLRVKNAFSITNSYQNCFSSKLFVSYSKHALVKKLKIIYWDYALIIYLRLVAVMNHTLTFYLCRRLSIIYASLLLASNDFAWYLYPSQILPQETVYLTLKPKKKFFLLIINLIHHAVFVNALIYFLLGYISKS